MPLSTGTYGKASPMAYGPEHLADRLTAILATARAALGELNSGIATGAPVGQAPVNTLTKVLQDLGEIATTVRKDAADEAEQAAQDTSDGPTAAAGQKDTSPAAKTGSGSASTPGTSAKS